MAQSSEPASELGVYQVPPDAVLRAVQEAKKEGLFAGLSSGLASAVLGQRLMGFNKNKTILCGTLTAALAGYLFTQAFTETHLAQLHEEARRVSRQSNTGNPQFSSAQQSDIK
ncbi:hypothetical protein FPV67DRAFT_306452 [Lyophyllum atratum]|nr:hypothetical protein FPV67DRAFT_306452 [Lyophyllum atratum]